jgi:hypothetical protein
MVRLKKYRVHRTICDICKGNGFVKVVHADLKEHVHQCWECGSEGEFYVYKDNADHGSHNTYKFLH